MQTRNITTYYKTNVLYNDLDYYLLKSYNTNKWGIKIEEESIW